MKESVDLLCARITLVKGSCSPRSDFVNSREGGQDHETFESHSKSSEEVG